MQYRPLPAGVKLHGVRPGVQETHECGDEAVIRQVLGQLIVYLRIGGIQIGAEPKSHPHHGLHLRGG